MALVTALVVGVGGVGGAVARHAVGKRLRTRVLDTVVVNVVGSFLLGLVLSAPVADPTRLAAGAGFCGAFTTFSSFAVDTVRLAEDGRRARAGWVAVGTLALAVVAVLLGLRVGGSIPG